MSSKMTPFHANLGYTSLLIPSTSSLTAIYQANFYINKLISIMKELRANVFRAVAS